MADLSYTDALADVGAAVAMSLEVKDPGELEIVERCLGPAVVALALLLVEADAELRRDWTAAGRDWVERGRVLREALLFVLRPEGAVR